MAFIIIFNIILYLLLIFWTYKNMYALELKPKIIFMIGSVLFTYIITKILYNIGGNLINKELGDVAITFNRTMVILFTGINALTIIPYIALKLNQYKEQIIDESKLKKIIIIILIIFIVFIIFEFNYMKDVQFNMLQIINKQ